MESRDGALYQRRWRIGYDGNETEVQESRVDFVMGSGNHVKTFLTQTPRGGLIELPLAWYSEGGGTWAMNPGHDRDYALPPRSLAYECMFCHNAYPKIPAGHDEPGSEALYEGELPQGIDCARCHGAGDAHIRAAETPGAKVEDIRKAIVNPARLGRDRQIEVCMQCHLETTSPQLPHSIVKYGRSPFSYRAGEPLGDLRIFLRPCSRQQVSGRFRDRPFRLSPSQIEVLPRKQNDLPHLPRSPRRAQRRGGHCALQRRVRYMSSVFDRGAHEIQ
jgi:hypothetical protein